MAPVIVCGDAAIIADNVQNNLLFFSAVLVPTAADCVSSSSIVQVQPKHLAVSRAPSMASQPVFPTAQHRQPVY